MGDNKSMFTKEDIGYLIADYKMIESFIRKNYVQKLVENEIVTVSFGEHSLISFSTSFIRVTCDSNTYSFTNDIGILNIYECPEGAAALVFNWNTVKNNIESEFLRRERKRAQIRDFCIGFSRLDELLSCQKSHRNK